MTLKIRVLFFLLATASPIPSFAQQTPAETAADEPVLAPVDDLADAEDSDDIVVVGQKPRGSVVGDIPPENTLTRRDIRATGATSISELLDAVAAQTGSARGRSAGRPILLLNGQRISGFRELRDLPPEAIDRMEILPEEVALKYGYAADQRVVNIVLRRRFNSTSVELRGAAATDGDYAAGLGDATRLTIRDGQRTSLNAHLEGNTSLYEDDRDIAFQPDPDEPDALDPRPFRTLVGARQNARVSGTVNRTVLGDFSGTINGEVERETGRSRFGVPDGALTDFDPLTRDTRTEAVRMGAALNGQRGKWRLWSTANAEIARSTSRADSDLGALADRDRSRSIRRSLVVDGTANGPLFALPAGEANATFKVGLGSLGLDSKAIRSGIVSSSDPDRQSGEASFNLDLPITKRSASIGRISANLNAGLAQLSDFGTLTSLGAGLNWSPAARLNLLTSWTREEGAPSLQQLGDPEVETSGVRFFDYSQGETVFVTAKTGGNEDLKSDRRNVFKIGGNWQPAEKLDLRLRAEYVRQTIDNPQASFPAATEALETAFPERFDRDLDNKLVRVDLRPVNFDKSRKDTFRWGFDFTKPLKSEPPSQGAIAAMRQRFASQRGPGTAPPAQTPGADAGPGPGRGFGGGRGGGRFGGGQGGRLTFSLTHQLNLVDKVKIADGLRTLDYLDGEAFGSSGGRPRHELQVETGYYNNGLGARLQGNWRSATTVDSNAGDLRFSPYSNIDLRFFANLGERYELVAKHPFLRGTSVRLEVNNIFNSRPKVRDADGLTPLSYQPDLLEPVGRTVSITFRKLFIPTRFFQRGGGGGRRPAD